MSFPIVLSIRHGKSKDYLKIVILIDKMLRNTAKSTVLAKNIIYCRSFLSKAMGLMFTKPLGDNAMVFHFTKEKRISLHMFFVFYPIDVLWLNKEKKVVQIKEHFKPFHVAMAEKPAMYIIELPHNTIKKTNTNIGDSISF